MKVEAHIPIGWIIWSPWMLVVTFQNLGLEESPTKKYWIFSSTFWEISSMQWHPYDCHHGIEKYFVMPSW